MSKLFKFITLFSVFGLLACSKNVESQMQEYLEFYYPSSGTFFYQIAFEWGDYIIDTGPSSDEELHADSELYRGFITARTSSTVTPQGEKLFTYLVTPKGDVWITDKTDIAETKTRKEVVEEKVQGGISTATTTINSTSEPVIDHFLKNRESWTKYGTLKSSDGKSYSLELEAKQ